MFNLLPLTFIFTLFLWAAVLYIFLGCAQLIIFERLVKKDNPHVKSYRTMTDEQKKNIKKIGWKISRGLLALIGLGLIDYFFARG